MCGQQSVVIRSKYMSQCPSHTSRRVRIDRTFESRRSNDLDPSVLRLPSDTSSTDALTIRLLFAPFIFLQMPPRMSLSRHHTSDPYYVNIKHTLAIYRAASVISIPLRVIGS